MDGAMDTTCDIRPTTISDLPSEVLSHIFTFLPHSLKVIRLVCTEWYKACNVEEVAGHETIIIDAEQQKRTFIEDFFSNKKHLRQIYRLRLCKMAFKSHHISFFENYGHNLRSLRFFGCRAVEYLPFLQYCTNLHTLHLSYWTDASALVHLFRGQDGNLLQTNIVTLKIGYRATWSDQTLDACFRICPHLRSFFLHWDEGEQYYLAQRGAYVFVHDEQHVFNRPDILSFSCHYQALSMRATTLIELELNALNGILPEQMEQIASIPNLRLQKLKLYDHDTLMNKNICSIVNLQPNLQDIRISGCERITCHGLADWIEKCPEVSYLKIRLCDDNGFFFDQRLLEALTSRPYLRTLIFATRNDSSILDDFEKCQGTFDQLRALELDIELTDIEFDRILQKVSVNLDRLILNDSSSKLMESISNRFINLRKFSFGIYDSDHFPNHPVEQLWHFNKLRSLRINKSPQDDFSPMRLFRRIEAPNLQVLEIFGFDPIHPALLSEMVISYPLMENFYQYQYQYDYSCMMDLSCLSIISGWQRLNSFHCDNIQHVQLHRRIEDEEMFDLTLRSGGSSLTDDIDPELQAIIDDMFDDADMDDIDVL